MQESYLALVRFLLPDRFHVQKLAHDAVQEIRIKHRWEAIDQENQAIEAAKLAGLQYHPEILANGDTLNRIAEATTTCQK